ncbi:hypothetical protein H2200_011964 [Cladophialophora chaetospira]|uniref:Telomerase activating protein Est1 n=1 Tax=Cladophialophora chaetospira TaxID=386627 RepID=A0AA38WZ55_9EURO|nr:hypothetical protein H2200_011964 [Cladophialophora chaetospira]
MEDIARRALKFRAACQDYIFIDFKAAAEKQIEERLWAAHGKVNLMFRPFLARFRDGDGQKLKVERRKAEKVYLAFIKSSQTFYRGYIQRLASNFKDIPEILSLARGMGFDTFSADMLQDVDHDLKKLLVISCYSALVQCGDLSRYRETELKANSRNWGPAVGYYKKAAALHSADGRAYNQLAVLAGYDRDHLRTVYYFSQAICVEAPFPQAPTNLDREFNKLRKKAKQGESIAENADAFKGSRHLYERFLLFHARCWDTPPAEQEEQQSEILRLIADEIREQPDATILRKFSLINIAAEKRAADKVSGDESAYRPFQILQSFNVKVFSSLLKLVHEELRQLAGFASNPGKHSLDEVPRITRRNLPHLRLYSGWLLSTVHLLLANTALVSQMHRLWCVYARTLTILLRLFPRSQSGVEYLLKEDGETLGFSGYTPFVRRQRFYHSDQIKSMYTETTFGPQIPDDEMRFRIKELARDAALLIKSDEFKAFSIPLTFANFEFVYLGEDEDYAQSLEPAAAFAAGARAGSQSKVHGGNEEYAVTNGEIVRQIPSQHDSLPDAEGSMASRMENMVDDLTRSGATRRRSNPSSTAYDVAGTAAKTPVAQAFTERGISPSQPGTFNARDLVQRIQNSSGSSQPSPRPQAINIAPLPSIWNTPFAPRPGETPDSSPRPGSAHRLMHPPSVPGHLTSSAEFQTTLTHLQENIQLRTSPQSSFQPTMSSHYDTPTNMTSWLRSHDQMQSPSSPWASGFVSAVPAQQQTPISTKASNASPFGAIGESRPRSSRTPNSGQPG